MIAYLPDHRADVFEDAMASESVSADAAVDTTGVMAASNDLDVHVGDLDMSDIPKTSRANHGNSVGRHRTSATVRQPAAAALSTTGSFAISDEDDGAEMQSSQGGRAVAGSETA